MSLPADTLLWKFGKSWVSPFVKKYYHIEYSGEIPQPPFLLISNHVSPIDPFLIAPYINNPISWVVAQISFQNSIERYFLKKTGAIQKFKSRPDPATLYSIFNVLNKGGAVGLFPEGTITWIGIFQEHLLSQKGMNKLLLSLNVPIVATRIQGAWLSHPIWANHARKPKILVDFEIFTDSSAINFIRHSEWEWQNKNRISYPGKGKAQGIERVLWICPHCFNFRTITGKGDNVFCSSCKKFWTIDNFGLIGGMTLPDLFNQHIDKFSQWVKEDSPVSIPFVQISLRNAQSTKLMGSFSHQLTIHNDSIHIGSFQIDISKIRGVNTHFRDILEFRHEDTLIRIKSKYSSFLLYNWIILRKKVLCSLLREENGI